MTTALLALSLAAGCTSNPQPTPSNTSATRSNGVTVSTTSNSLESSATLPLGSERVVGEGGTTMSLETSLVPVETVPAVPPTTSLPVGTDPPPVSTGAVEPTDDVWYRLAMCESGVRNLRNAPYSGYFQFLPSTWRSLGLTGDPADHSYEEQRAGAIMLQARSGWGQWPACSKKLGLR